MRLLRTIVIAVVICGLLLGAALSALAVGPGKADKVRWWEGKIEVVQGQASINATSPAPGATGVINVDSKTIYVTANTTYKVPGLKTATISDIDGKYIVTQCDITATGLWARHVILAPSRLEGGKPEYGYQHHAGNVTAYSYDPSLGVNIAIQDKSGNLTPFQINDGNFRIMPPDATVAVGEWVTVISYRESPSSQLIAVGVYVYPPRPFTGPQRVSGLITAIDGSTITIADTPIDYNDSTLFVLRGVPAAVNQEATVFYTEHDGSKIAKVVLVETAHLSEIWAQFGQT
jgi:hypothetical protein